MRRPIPQITPLELRDELMGDRPPMLLDVREDEELEISRLPHAHHIPLGELPLRVSELKPEDDLVTYCHAGVRSNHAAAYLLARGFTRVRNLAGGIDRWARDVDPSMPRY